MHTLCEGILLLDGGVGMLTLLCRDIRGLYWISEVQEMSKGINIYSWCIVVHIIRKRSLLRGRQPSLAFPLFSVQVV